MTDLTEKNITVVKVREYPDVDEDGRVVPWMEVTYTTPSGFTGHVNMKKVVFTYNSAMARILEEAKDVEKLMGR